MARCHAFAKNIANERALGLLANKNNKNQVDHIDNNKSNNRVDNLQRVNDSENNLLRYRRD
jgi:hypothetical protein